MLRLMHSASEPTTTTNINLSLFKIFFRKVCVTFRTSVGFAIAEAMAPLVMPASTLVRTVSSEERTYSYNGHFERNDTGIGY